MKRGGKAMRLRPDTRKFTDDSERKGACRKCGCRLIFLPRDRRNGYCFECFDNFLIGDSDLEAT
ncbi:MAG: hypothetical protein ACE5QF_07470 [Thermoplasmata archaeon]